MRVEVRIYINSKEVFCMCMQNKQSWWIRSNALKEELSWWRKWTSFFCEHRPKLPHWTKALGLCHNSTIVWCISTILMPWMRIAGIKQKKTTKPLKIRITEVMITVMGIKLSFLALLQCPFNTLALQLIPRTSSINIRACFRHAAHNSVTSQTSMLSFISTSETLIENTSSSK